MKYKLAAKNYLDKSVRALMEDNPGKAYATLKRMGAQPGDCLDEGSFRLKEHTDANLSLAESAERISEHFAAISQHVREIMENEAEENQERKETKQCLVTYQKSY